MDWNIKNELGYKKDWEWNYLYHLPIPTLGFLLENGVDYANMHGSVDKAKSNLIQLCNVIQGQIKKNKTDRADVEKIRRTVYI